MDPQKNDRELEELLDRALKSYSEAEPSWGFEERILARAQDPTLRDAQGGAPRRWWMWWPAWTAATAVIVIAAVLPVAMRTRKAQEIAAPKQTVSEPAQVTTPSMAAQSTPAASAPKKHAASTRSEVAASKKRSEIDQLKASASADANVAAPPASAVATADAFAPKTLTKKEQDALRMDSKREEQSFAGAAGRVSDKQNQLADMKLSAEPERRAKLAEFPTARPQAFPTPSPMTAEERALVNWARSRPPQVAATAQTEDAAREEKPLAIRALKIEPLEVPEIGGGSR